ncbi:MAG TPA: LuxR C-terminal-related transcriptional regulator [Mycobacterium sp.]
MTAQERHVTRLAREGYTNPEIGAQLFLSPRTVEWHLGKIFAKLGVASLTRTEKRTARTSLTSTGHWSKPFANALELSAFDPAIGLRWSDIELNTGAPHIRRARVDVNGRDTIVPTKTERSARGLPVRP